MKSFLRLVVVCMVAAPGPSFGNCREKHLELETQPEVLKALRNHVDGKKIICIEDLGSTFDAPQYVLTVDESAKTARLERTGGAWGRGEDFGVTAVSIESDSRGFVPTKLVRSIQPREGRITDELAIKIYGSRGEARVRMDDGRNSKYLQLSLQCE